MDGQSLLELLKQIDYIPTLQTITPLAIVLVDMEVTKIKKYRLAKYAEPFKIEKVRLTPVVISKQKHISLHAKKYIGDNIEEFLKTLSTNAPDTDLSFLHKNLSRLVVSRMLTDTSECNGKYNPLTNHISIFKKCDSIYSVIYHELFHTATTVNKNGICYSGFSQVPYFLSGGFGTGINEGYTEYMVKKYFNTVSNTYYAYEVVIASCLDKIVGIKKMEKLYLTANLYGLIEELKKYAKEEEILQFITSIDAYASRESLGDEFKPKNTAIIVKHVHDVNTFIFKCYCEKLLLLYDNNIINLEDLEKNALDYIRNYINISKQYNVAYDKMNLNEIYKDAIESVFGKIELDAFGQRELDPEKIKRKVFDRLEG